MSRTTKALLLSVALLFAGTGAILIAQAAIGDEGSPPFRAQPQAQARIGPKLRNLSLQPEALRVSRRLGNRFTPMARAAMAMHGTLSSRTEQHPVTMIRRQIDSGEEVEVVVRGRRLIWRHTEGVKILHSEPTEDERHLVARLIFDSPDQFVLAQLRGASYYTIARNVRPVHADDNYNGPLWTLIRVEEPQRADSMRSIPNWRIYYINSESGLVDRVEYELNGREIQVDVVEWIEENGEKTPSRINWSSDGQIIMRFQADVVLHNQ